MLKIEPRAMKSNVTEKRKARPIVRVLRQQNEQEEYQTHDGQHPANHPSQQDNGGGA
jgi:hypothetical protein